ANEGNTSGASGESGGMNASLVGGGGDADATGSDAANNPDDEGAKAAKVDLDPQLLAAISSMDPTALKGMYENGSLYDALKEGAILANTSGGSENARGQSLVDGETPSSVARGSSGTFRFNP